MLYLPVNQAYCHLFVGRTRYIKGDIEIIQNLCSGQRVWIIITLGLSYAVWSPYWKQKMHHLMTLSLVCGVALYFQKENVPVNWTPLDPQIIPASFSTYLNGRVGTGLEANTSVLYGGSLYYYPLSQIRCYSIGSKKLRRLIENSLDILLILILCWPPCPVLTWQVRARDPCFFVVWCGPIY